MREAAQQQAAAAQAASHASAREAAQAHAQLQQAAANADALASEKHRLEVALQVNCLRTRAAVLHRVVLVTAFDDVSCRAKEEAMRPANNQARGVSPSVCCQR